MTERRMCVFCRKRDADTYEDAWSIWLRKAWREFAGNPNEMFDNSLSRGSVLKPEILREWKGRHRVGGFCRHCNNVWMSGMEDTVKPILKPMMLGERLELSPQALKRLARWAYLKSLVFTLSTPEIEVSASEYVRFFESRKPPHLGSVLLMQSQALFGGMLYRLENIDVHLVDGSIAQNWRGSFIIGHVILQVFGERPVTNARLRARPRRPQDWVRVIWPASGSFKWPLSTSLEPEAVGKMLDFFMDQRSKSVGPAA